jgi:hypothetical protein
MAPPPNVNVGVGAIEPAGGPDYPFGSFSLTEIDPPRGQNPLKIRAYLAKAPIVTAGYGGWSRVARPKRKAITEWVGRDSVTIEIQFLFDAAEWNDGLAIEGSCRDLESMAGVESTDPVPPLLELRSNPPALMPHGHHRASHVRWFVEGITWDADSIWYNNAGNRIRAGGTLQVTQYVEDARLKKLSGSKNRNSGRGGHGTRGSHRKKYTVKRGDTLSKIAARKDVYNDASKWKRIAKANHIRDPKRLRVGQELKIP